MERHPSSLCHTCHMAVCWNNYVKQNKLMQMRYIDLTVCNSLSLFEGFFLKVAAGRKQCGYVQSGYTCSIFPGIDTSRQLGIVCKYFICS